MRQLIKIAIAIMVVVLCAVSPSSATVLTFEFQAAYQPVNYQAFSTDYGDNVSALSDTVGFYEEGNGFTPNVTVDYASVENPYSAAGTLDYLTYWGNPVNGYGDLEDVAWARFGRWPSITITPEAGYGVVLNSFDMAGYLYDRQMDVLVITYSGGSFSPVSLPTTLLGEGHVTFTPNIVSEGPVTILFGMVGGYYSDKENPNLSNKLGIDNINFDQYVIGEFEQPEDVDPVPEPGTVLLVGAGLLGMVFFRKFLRK